MNRKFVFAALACTALSSPVFAQDNVPVADTAEGEDAIVVTAARTILPPNALPLTIDIIGKDMLDQQLAISAGVAVGAFAVEATMVANHSAELSANDFWPAFIVVAILSALSAFSFWKLPEDAGHEISGHKIPAMEGPKAAEAAAAESTHDARDQKLG